MNDDTVKFRGINDPNSFDLPGDVEVDWWPAFQPVWSKYSRLHKNPIHKRHNHRLAELRRRLGAAKYREHVAGKPIRGQSRIWHIYDEIVAFKEAATDYLVNATAIDAERISRQYPAMPEPK